ncbi:MAG: isoprenylcysteine carboxylmethyltransferase family protein [Vicinamibacterales bacterium]
MTALFRRTGFALFMAAVALTGWWWLRLPAVAGVHGGVRAVVLDTLLFSAFALHHSLLARTRAKELVTRVLPHDLVRSAYVWLASLLLMTMCLLWQPVGGELYRARGVAAAALWLVQIAGVAVSLLAIRRISVRELGGLADPRASDALEFAGPYGLVRHPLYTGWVLIFFPAPVMTGDRLLFAVVSTVYLLLAMPLEEAGLTAQFGDRYLEYRRAVRWRLIPYIH